jgi:hypothetical protein
METNIVMLLILLDAISYIVLATIFSFIIAYFFALLIPSPEMIDIMIYENKLLSQPRKNK